MKYLLLFITIFFAGCSTNLPVTQYPLPAASESKASIIFYRDNGFSYGLKTTFVGVDNYLVSGIKRNEYTNIEVPAGKHEIVAFCYDGLTNLFALPTKNIEQDWSKKTLNLTSRP